jgi:hypothetical protein
MKVGQINAQYELIRHQEIVRTERLHTEQLQHQKHIKQMRDDSEDIRIEANRRMNRAGQNVDRMA